MNDFIIQSIIASVVLTILLNVVPILFPKSSQKAERHIHEKMKEAFAEQPEGRRPKMKVFFPWKTMLVISLVLTVFANIIGFLSR